MNEHMNVRLLKKQLKQKGLSLKGLYALWDEVQNGNIIKMSSDDATSSHPSQRAFIFKSELDYISRCILDYKNIETGGQLFGYWTSDGSPVVAYAIGPGNNANHQIAFFNQDVDYLKTIGEILVRHYGLQHIGEWHSHHKLGLAQPSSHDAATMSDTIRQKNLGRFLLCIGNCTDIESTLNPFNFTQEKGYNYIKSHWCMYGIQSPFRSKIDMELQGLILHPNTQQPNYGFQNIIKVSESLNIENTGYWFESKENRITLKSIIDFISCYPQHRRCSIQMDNRQHVHLYINKSKRESEHIYFPHNFPNEPPNITIDGIIIPDMNWEFNGDIYTSFVKYYKKIFKYDGR